MNAKIAMKQVFISIANVKGMEHLDVKLMANSIKNVLSALDQLKYEMSDEDVIDVQVAMEPEPLLKHQKIHEVFPLQELLYLSVLYVQSEKLRRESFLDPIQDIFYPSREMLNYGV